MVLYFAKSYYKMNFATMFTNRLTATKAQAYLERQKDKPYWPFVNFYKLSVYFIFVFYFTLKFIYLAALGLGYHTWFVGQNLGFLCSLKLNKKYRDPNLEEVEKVVLILNRWRGEHQQTPASRTMCPRLHRQSKGLT